MNHEPRQPGADKTWTAALYIRLSREDEDGKDESNSVTTQREILKELLRQKPEIRLYDFYVDDGWSGTNFDRPDFRRMMRDLYAGHADCVIVKDLSRLGRNASETGMYLDNVFPRLNIRFIALNNGIDTAFDNMNAATRCLTVGVQNLVNESVAASTSVNVRGTLNVTRQQGKFIGSFAAYGYRKDPDDRHRLLIDPETAPVVRRIFEKFVSGESILGIARWLNETGIPNPSAYKRQKGLNYRHPAGGSGELWPDSSVRRILQNEVYIGNMVQGRNTTVSYKIKQCRAVPRENWIVVQGTHEAIVEKELFYRAQELFGRGIRRAPEKAEPDLFSGLVRCADCGRAMHKKTNAHAYGTYVYYRCATAYKLKTDACRAHTIRADKLEEAVTVTLQKLTEAAADMAQVLERINRNPAKKTESALLQQAIAAQQAEKERLHRLRLELYPDWKSGVLTAEEYLEQKQHLEEKNRTAEEKLRSLEASAESLACGVTAENEFIATFRKYGSIRHLNRAMLLELVEEIRVGQNGDITVCFRFRDAFREAEDYIRENGEIAAS